MSEEGGQLWIGTSGWVYAHWRGVFYLAYASCYGEEELCWWAGQIDHVLSKGYETYVYFNSDAYGYAVQNAQRLRELLQTG